MSRDIVHYLVPEKNPHHGRAIEQGFKARLVNASNRKLARNALHIIGGLQHGALELLQQARAAGEPYIFVDRAYFGGGPGSNRLRVVPSAYQHHWRERRPSDRWEALAKSEGGRRKAEGLPPLEIAPWRTQGAHVLLVPPSAAICQLFGLGDWCGEMERRLRDCFDGPVVVSRKGDPRPLAERLANCWAVVTYTSNVAVEAILAGVPCFTDRKSAAADMALDLSLLWERIETPYYPDNRLAWASALAYGQWTVDEIASGAAAAAVLPHFRES